MLDNEFKYYLENQDDLVAKYNGKYIVIVGQQVVNAYNSDEEAYFDSTKKYTAGTFLIQFCEPGEGSYKQSFHSRVTFK